LIQLALRNAPSLHEAAEGVAIAQAQQTQARSGYFPRLSLTGGSLLLDRAMKFRIPAGSLSIDLSSDPVLGQLIKDPITNPKQIELSLTDQWINFGLLSLTQPLFTGGMVTGYARQARHNLELARRGQQGQQLTIIREVIGRYNDLVLATRLVELGESTLTKLETTLSFSRSLYLGGSPRMTKLDYLRTKLAVSAAASVVEELRAASARAREALAYAAGIETRQIPALDAQDFAVSPVRDSCQESVQRALRDRPEVGQLESGLAALRAGVEVARSRYFPDLALVGGALVDNQSLRITDGRTFYVGLMLSLSVFDGLQTYGRVAEARARVRQLEARREMAQRGLAAQVRDACLTVEESRKQLSLSLETLRDASEHLTLTERSYQASGVELEAVIKAQIIEALARVRHLHARHQLSNREVSLHHSRGDLSSYRSP
jgi:outer membrane protein TolC